MGDLKKILLAVIMLLPLTAATAQSLRKLLERPVDIIHSEWERDSEGNAELNYYNEDYCDYYLFRMNDDSYNLKPGKNTVFKKMKNENTDNQFHRASTFRYYRGRFPKSFNIETPYALPVKSGQKIAWRTDKREQFKTLEFHMKEGDTIYAVRGGVACRTVVPQHLLVRHDDQTFAAYLVMTENFVSPGENVKVGQPVGIVGTMGFAISFFFLDKNKFEGLDAAGYPYSHFIPMFRTTEGTMKLQEKKPYEALLDDELIMLDMSKREQKKYLKNKK